VTASSCSHVSLQCRMQVGLTTSTYLCSEV